MPPLNALWLESFVTLCETGHFTRAAARLNMTQPGLSQHIKKLEAQLDQPLLSRDGKSFVPTPAGEALLALGRRRRTEEEALRQSLVADDPGAGPLHIACSGSLALLLYPRLVALMQEAPRLTLHLEATPQPRIIDGLAEGRFDLGITDHAPRHPRLAGRRCGEDALCLLLPAGHPAPRRFADLDALGFVTHPDGPAYADALLGANFPEDYPGADRLRLCASINQIGQIPLAVAEGLGYTILPRSGLAGFAGIERLSLPDLPRPHRHGLWLLHRKHRVLPARAARVARLIAETLA
ncbi:LysR family transcriptional regulator [Roseovarius sp. C7]|uniref:LysR family transcriptional regulator n=1 Tax=Roseovarius sp. C7 TaxID=3398643 RepID=UPI0039F71788